MHIIRLASLIVISVLLNMLNLAGCSCGGGTDIVANVDATCDDGILNQDEEDIDCGGVCRACPVEETCYDDLQNQDETGVDCGGVCDACPTCVDGIQNQGETAIDCGGPCQACATCNDGLQNGDEEDVDCGGSCTACPTCTDGIRNQDEERIDCGGPACAPCPTCEDGLQNGDETGVDCGGASCLACPTCADGILNGDEEDIDCGGELCEACPTCDDGILNQDEEDIDCGGSCTACPTCTDGLLNQGEEDIDCGGPCTACPTCDDGIMNQGEEDVDCGGPCGECVYFGAISGKFCTTATYEGVVNGTVIVRVLIDGSLQSFTTTTNSEGEFTLDPVPTGTHDIVVTAGNFFNEISGVTVTEGQTTVLAEDPNCTQPVGNIVGNFCSPSEILGIADATVTTQYIDNGEQATRTTQTDADGNFVLEDLPVGSNYVVTITKNSFVRQVSGVQVLADQDNPIVTEACVAPEPPRMKVITGTYDHVEDVLEYLGYDDVEIINVADPLFNIPFLGGPGNWLNTQFGNLSTFQNVDILFINCRNLDGVNYLQTLSLGDILLTTENVRENLATFVRNGGSIYFSDWSYDIMELAFPDAVDWVGDDDSVNDAQVAPVQSFTATVVDPDIASTTIRTSLNMSFDSPEVAIAETLGAGSSVLVEAPISYVDPVTEQSINNATIPIVLEYTVPGSDENSGRVIFTSVHNEDGSAEIPGADMTALLAAIIYSL